MHNCTIRLTIVALTSLLAAAPAWSAAIDIENASFEAPAVDPNGFGALPFVEGWTEVDVDTEGSANTGVFGNTPAGSPDHLVNADGNQLAFLGSGQGNALEQDLEAIYQVGRDYELTVAVGISSRFPPAMAEPVDTLELVLYYVDANDLVPVAHATVAATGLSSTELQDFSVYLPAVSDEDAWAGKTIGVAIRAAGAPGGFWDLDHVHLEETLPLPIAIANASFEAPPVDPNAFPALPFVDGWIEIDTDAEGGTNTGVFGNTPADSADHVANADGRQLAFLASGTGNALEQDLAAVYRPGAAYRMTVAVGVSNMFPPAMEEPADALELAFYYVEDANVVDLATATVPATGLSATELRDFSVALPTVLADDAWAGKPIGVAIRASGAPGGFWDLDHVRLTESLPVSASVENASFESPVVDPNAFPALPYVDGWTETDLDVDGSTNTGVFANTPVGSWDRMLNADGEQLAFLGSEQGNGLEQDLETVYQVGATYRLTVAVGPSGRFPPSAEEPVDTLELALYYRDEIGMVDIATLAVEPTELESHYLKDFSVYLSPVGPDEVWAGEPIGVAIRSAGMAGGFWDLDNVRLAASIPDAASVEE